MLITTLGFFALTAAMVWFHLRSRGVPAAPHVVMHAAGAPCPRCQANVPVGSQFCAACGVPQQIFDVVSAPTALAEAAGATAAGMLRALVRADMCVGCGTCVAECPEPGAITMRGKLAVVDDAKCKGHADCVKGCPVGAISMNAGAAVNRVSVPLVDANFETTVPGLYIVGELGGRGLIKNAINEGKLALEHVARTLSTLGDAEQGVVDVVIVGSGPAGLSAALEAHRRQLKYVVLEQGTISDTVRKYPRHKVLLAESTKIPMYGDLWVADSSKEELLRMWEGTVANAGLIVRTGEKVERIERGTGHFAIETPLAKYRARRVVLAMGRRGTPRRLGVPGEELDKVFYDIVEMEAFAERRVLVVGGGDSAAESAVGLANQSGTEVTLSYRGDAFSRITNRNREKIERAIAMGAVQTMFKSQLREIRPDVVVLDAQGESTILPNDMVVIRIGGEAPTAFLEKLGVRIVQKDVPIPRSESSAKAG